jgi:surface antigen
MKRISSVAIVLTGALALAGCQTSSDPYASNSGIGVGQGVGTVGGAVLGGIAGNQFGGGRGQVAATIAGAVIGGFLGGAVGQQIDTNDRDRARRAQLAAVQTGNSRSWRGESSDAYGSVEPGEIYTSSSGRCREYTHTIFIGGRPQQGRGTACQNADGQWEIVS